MKGVGLDLEHHWKRTAKRLAARANRAAWLSRTLPWWAGASLVAACILLLLRRHGAADLTGFWAATFLALTGLGLFQYFRLRSTRWTSAGAFVWLEHRLGLNNRLTAASAGVGGWPSPDARAHELLRWRASHIAPAFLFSLALLSSASWVPVTVATAPLPPPIEPPLAWSEAERLLEELRDSKLVEEDAVEAWEEKLDSLEQQPSEEWYRHSSLEAGDSLKEELESGLFDLERGLSSAESALDAMLRLDESSSATERRLAERGLQKALEELELASLPLDRKIKRRLETLARERKVRKLDKEELERLRARLRERRYHDLPRPGDEAYAFAVPGAGDGRAGSGGLGRGGVTRGPGSAPIELASERTELGSSRIEDVMGRKALGTELGETVGVSLSEHEVDTHFRSGLEAGEVVSKGEGGDVVWSQTLTPEERRVLKKYFK